MLDRLTHMRKSALLAFILIAGCAEHGHGDVAAEVRKDALGVVAAYNAQDAHAAAAYDAPDYVGVYHGSPNVNGPAADEAGMKAQMAATRVEWQLGKDKVTVAKAGDLALFEAPYTFVITNPEGGVVRESGSWIAMFRRQDDGSMKLWRSIASDGPPSTSPAG
jgi:ketosteroid isomerase-like protein